MSRISLLLILFTLGCFNNSQKEKEYYYSTPITLEQLVADYKTFNVDYKSAIKATEIGIFFPNDTSCTKKNEVLPALSFEWLNLGASRNSNHKLILYAMLENLYKLFGDPTIAQNEGYDYIDIPISHLLDSLKSGHWAPQCGGISNITNRLISNFYKEYYTSIIHLDYPIHTVSCIKFIEDNTIYSLVFDAQNGFIFPVDSNNEFISIQSISKMNENEIIENLNFLWLDHETLLQKRNLLERIMPCNFLVDNKDEYHFGQENSPYKFEKISYSFHKYFWFDLKNLNIDSIKLDITKKLLENYSD